MATIRQKQSADAITIGTFQQHRHFQRTANAQLMIATLFRYCDSGKFSLHAFAIMPDDIQVLITPATDQSTARCIHFIKGGYSFTVREQFEGEFWTSGSHELRIRDQRDFDAQKQYIANHPSRENYLDYPHIHKHLQTVSTQCLPFESRAFSRGRPRAFRP